VGKSTLVDRLVEAARGKGQSVGVVAVDPSSPLSGGALLGDRIRMQRHASDGKVFIRSLASRGSLGGLSRTAFDTVSVLDAMGKDLVLLETAGVGQDGVKVAGAVHTVVVALAPGMGDDIQALKAGILEVGDVYVVNKRARKGAGQLARSLRLALDGLRPEGWERPVVLTEALEGQGVSELDAALRRHRRFLEEGGGWERRSKAMARAAFLEFLEAGFRDFIAGGLEGRGEWKGLLSDLAERREDPRSAARRALRRLTGDRP
jgi:LAO/AO transport system kinase